jgi:cytoskeletal protein RodZ
LVGELLRKKREELGKDLRDISKTLKISYSYLNAIEDEAFEKLPEEVYVKGYIRKYAEILHINPDIAVKAYIQQISPSQTEDKKTIERDVIQRKSLRIKNLLIPLLSVFLAITIAFIIFLSSRDKKETPQTRIETKKEIPAPLSLPAKAKKDMLPLRVEAKKEITSHTAGTEKENMLNAKNTPHTLEVSAIDTTWLLITTDKTSTKDMILKKGDSVKLQAQEGFTLKIGNAGGVKLIFDRENIGKLGEMGQVITLKLP